MIAARAHVAKVVGSGDFAEAFDFWYRWGEMAQAVRVLEWWAEADPSPGPRNALAWFLATALDPEVRDATRAVELAEAVVERDRVPRHLDTLAAAYARAGRFDEAVRAEREAIALARTSRPASELATLQASLVRFETREPRVDDAAGRADATPPPALDQRYPPRFDTRCNMRWTTTP